MPDEGLLRFCNTDRQREIVQAVEKAGGNQAQAARELDLARGTVTTTMNVVKRRAARNGYAPEHDMTRTVPDGFKVKGVSTYYDKEGNPAGQWVKSTADEERQREIFEEAIRHLAAELPRLDPIPAPTVAASDLLAVYPVGDHHFGMLSWREETGADYDLSIAERLLCSAMMYLVESVPACDTALIAFLGDLLHYDSFAAVTPKNKNLLDSDSRYPKMVRVVVRVVRTLITTALKRHKLVRVIIEFGNHDPASTAFLIECLAALYENEPRVEIDRSPSRFHYFRFGKVLIGTTHGDGPKLKDLPLIMAADRPEDWGATTARHWLTGHIHHDEVKEKDFAGCKAEALRVLAPGDAWSTGMGHRSMQSMRAITFHREYGEVGRSTFSPAMLEGAA